MKKSFLLAYLFNFISIAIMTFFTEDFILSSAISLLLSLAVFLFFSKYFFDDEPKEDVKEDEEYITLFTINR